MNPDDIDGFRIVLKTVGQKEMRLAGPMVPASWYITEERERELRSARKTVPQPIEGFLLLDTGAATIMIDSDVAKQLGLEPIGKTSEVHGIKGYESIDHYNARLLLPVIPLHGSTPMTPGPVKIGIPTEAWESTGMMANYLKWGYESKPGVPLKVIGVLGRIFLQFTTMTFNGMTGSVEIFIDKSSMFAQHD